MTLSAPTLWAPTEEEERPRATMWDVPRFAEYHDYELVVENVVEAAKWKLFRPGCRRWSPARPTAYSASA
jgi:hypothetical protein